jgi:hypothetical protein
MNKIKVLSISKKISSSNLSEVTPNSVNAYVCRNQALPMFDILSAEEIAMISFITPMVKTNKDLDSLYDEIKLRMFSFINCEIRDVSPTQDCNRCNSYGYIECSSCDGDKEIECDECRGSGEDDDGETCDWCQGDGNVDCSNCSGDGSVTCPRCVGSGEMIIGSKYEVDVREYLSWDTEIFNILETKDDITKLNPDLVDNIDNMKTFVMNILYNELVNPFSSDEDDSNGDVYFIEINKNVSLYKLKQGNHIGDKNLIGI